MSKKKNLNAGNDKRGRPYFQINGKFVSRKKWLRISQAQAQYLYAEPFRGKRGRFAKREIPRPIAVEQPKELSRIVLFYERIRNTRIRRLMRRTYPLTISEEQIDYEIMGQKDDVYAKGGNYAIGIVSITIGELKPNTEQEIERGPPGSGELS
jgi:hypothetical protein